jgi:hypothetical protein
MNFRRTQATPEPALSTVNTALRDPVSGPELAGIIRDRHPTLSGRDALAAFTFFVEVPLQNQISFLTAHRITVGEALGFADLHVRPHLPLGRLALDHAG